MSLLKKWRTAKKSSPKTNYPGNTSKSTNRLEIDPRALVLIGIVLCIALLFYILILQYNPHYPAFLDPILAPDLLTHPWPIDFKIIDF